jgi:DNA-binding CsgD family transcriptional regulator
MNPPDLFTDREQEVADYLLQGKTNKQIAHALGVSTRTVEYHISHIYEKLGVSSRAEAIVRLSEARLRESASESLRESDSDLREPTVVETRYPDENDGKSNVFLRRITMNKALLVILGLIVVTCLGLAALAAFSLIPFNLMTRSIISGATEEVMPQATYTPWHTPTPGAFVTATPFAPGEAGTVLTEQPLQLVENTVMFEGVRFELDPAVADNANGQVLPENPASDDGPYWEVYPQYVKIPLTDYALSDTAFAPVVAVYPAAEYRRLSAQAGEQLDILQTMLAGRPEDASPMPFLPIINMGQVFHSNVQYLDFRNGSGVRYLTQYAQGINPVNNRELFYTFQGLTADGSQFISITLPVSHSSLPADPSALSEAEYTALVQNSNYYNETAAALSAQPDDSFAPSLGQLDALVESLLIER